MIQKFSVSFLFLLLTFTAQAQNFTDGIFMPKNNLCVGISYMNDSWKNYWEGTLKRENQNIGTITTQSAALMASYGIIDNLSVLAMLPYVSTNASGGTLAGMSGIQDLTAGIKYKAVEADVPLGKLSVIGVAACSLPVGNYTPDFMPLSIGLASQTVSGRVTLNYQTEMGIFANVTGSYTSRSIVKLDRPSYYADGQLHNSSEVAMPDVSDFQVSAGYKKGELTVHAFLMGQNTLGGGDIRRQDMPFVSYKMNYTKVGVFGMYYLPFFNHLAVQVSGAYTMAGRNVGQSLTYTGGVFYFFEF